MILGYKVKPPEKYVNSFIKISFLGNRVFITIAGYIDITTRLSESTDSDILSELNKKYTAIPKSLLSYKHKRKIEKLLKFSVFI